jgi:ATP phosphoribosyltransferase regulatory subunit
MRTRAEIASDATAPDYSGESLDRLNRVTVELTSIFNEAGFEPIEPAILQPAALLFDLYGEEIWDRAFFVEDGGEDSWCLRPDFTAPVAQAHLRRMAAGETGAAARYGYVGPAFRRSRAGEDAPVQHLQAGVEAISAGGGSVAELCAAEAEVFRICQKALDWSGLSGLRVVTGDLGVVRGLLDALALPAGWRRRLIRHFRRPERFGALLHRFAGESERGGASRIAFLKAVGGMAPEDAAQVVDELLALSEVPHIGTRSVDEIADRFLRLAADAQAHPLSREMVTLVESVLAVRDRSDAALARIGDLARAAGVDLSPALERLQARLDAFAALGIDAGALRFDASFGRNIDYYDGFVFELSAPDATGGELRLGGGGRYDRLFEALGRPGAFSAVGAALRPEAIASALNLDAVGGGTEGARELAR